MCLLSIGYNAHSDFPLVFIGNRDEYHARPSAAADWWTDHDGILGGRDLEAGGTWLAVNRAGHLGVITNRPDLPPPAEDARSRGELIPDWLNNPHALEELYTGHHAYGGFSLLLADSNCQRLISGGNGAGKVLQTASNSGVSGLSNTAPDQPWPKLTWLNNELRNHLAAGEPDIDALMHLLTRREPVPDSISHGVPATPFVVGDTYGTRCCTVILINRLGECTFHERRFGPGGVAGGESEFQFRIESA